MPRVLILPALLLLLLASVAMAQPPAKVGFAKVGLPADPFASFPMDARGEAMGLATTVNPLGPAAFWWNPAPLPAGDGVAVSYTAWEHPLDYVHLRPLAIRVSRGNLTTGLLWNRESLDPMPVLTGHEPDGTGEMLDARYDLFQFGLAADLVPWLLDGSSPWTWTVGAGARHFRRQLGDSDGSAWDADLGTSLAWGREVQAASLRLHATAMARNLFRGALDLGGLRSVLPRYYHFGAGLEAGFGRTWRGQRLIAGTASFVLRRDLEALQRDYDSEHVGFEVTAAGILSARVGHRTEGLWSIPDDGWSWGAGAQYRFPASGLRVAVDYAAYDTVHPLWDDQQLDRWTFTLGFGRPQ